MKIQLVYDSGQTYWENLTTCTVEVRRISDKIIVELESTGNSKKAGKLTMKPESAERLAHALLLARAGNVDPIKFAVDEQVPKAAAA